MHGLDPSCDRTWDTLARITQKNWDHYWTPGKTLRPDNNVDDLFKWSTRPEHCSKMLSTKNLSAIPMWLRFSRDGKSWWQLGTGWTEGIEPLKNWALGGHLRSRVWARVNWIHVCSLVHTGTITVERSVERNIPCCSWALLQSMAGCTHEQSGLLPGGQVPALLVSEVMGFDRTACSLQPSSLLSARALVCVGESSSCEWGTGTVATALLGSQPGCRTSKLCSSELPTGLCLSQSSARGNGQGEEWRGAGQSGKRRISWFFPLK